MASLIPDELFGKNTQLSSVEKTGDKQSAQELYSTAVERLLHPGVWSSIAGLLSAKFELFTGKEQKPDAPAAENDRIRINIPGPGAEKGHGYDWVKILQVESGGSAETEEEYTGIKVEPTDDPFSTSDDAAHFFEPGATSTFLIHRKGNEVTAAYYGRNEKINAKTEGAADKVRNAVVGLGAYAGFSELQWKALVKGFLKG